MLRKVYPYIKTATVAAVFCASSYQMADAGLLGDTVTGEFYQAGGSTNLLDPSLGIVPSGSCQNASSQSVVSDPNLACGPEFQFDNNAIGLQIDITDNEIRFTQELTADSIYASQFFRISDIDDTIIGLTEVSDTFTFNGGFGGSIVNGSLEFAWAAGDVPNGVYNATYRISQSVSAIPLPGTLALLAVGLIGLGCGARCRR